MTTITVTAPGGRRVELQNAMRLTPTAGTEMHGRDGMLMHNGNFATMDSSQGCLVEHNDVRGAIGTSGINDLEVVH